MTVIIDASSLTAFLLEEGVHQKIREYLIEGMCGTELVVTESSNAILTAVRQKRINEDQAEKALEVLLSFAGTNIKIFEQSDSLIREAYQNARENGLAIYDSLYITLAKQLRGSLLSGDSKQIEAAKKSGVRIVSLSN